ncbi:MAG TPA: hypothetical protein VF629_03960 [Hymenobacter sp.]|jgi:hypothetical protein|uniref:hypothetical protein n=1 Tax=Hymenobacter sp. TaxID=1898978 RepID=UPI002EDB8549
MTFSQRNQFRVAATSAELAHFRRQAWRLYEPVAVPVFGRKWQLRPGLTFTPFANAVRCTAHCAFCFEELQRYDGHQLTAKRLIDDFLGRLPVAPRAALTGARRHSAAESAGGPARRPRRIALVAAGWRC